MLKKSIAESQKSAVDIETSSYAKRFVNNMMLDHMGSDRVYHLDPIAHEAYLENVNAESEFPSTVFVQFEEGAIDNLSAETVATMFAHFGDFFV